MSELFFDRPTTKMMITDLLFRAKMMELAHLGNVLFTQGFFYLAVNKLMVDKMQNIFI